MNTRITTKTTGNQRINFLLSYQTDIEFKVLLPVCPCYSSKRLRIELALNHSELKKNCIHLVPIILLQFVEIRHNIHRLFVKI